MNKTVPRRGDVSALIVGCEGNLGMACSLALRGEGLEVVRVPDVAAACERIPVAQPRVIVVPNALREQIQGDFEDRAIAVGAELVWVDEAVERSEIITRLMSATERAIARATGGKPG